MKCESSKDGHLSEDGSAALRPRRNAAQKGLALNSNLHWTEEKDLKKALYASLNESRKSRFLDSSSSDIGGDHDSSSKCIPGTSGSGKNLTSGDPNSKRTRVHAQRKFAQGSNPSSPVPTPIKSCPNTGPGSVLLPCRRPKTEDFLTFLCLRGTDALPLSLDFLNAARKPDSYSERSDSPDLDDTINGIDSKEKGTPYASESNLPRRTSSLRQRYTVEGSDAPRSTVSEGKVKVNHLKGQKHATEISRHEEGSKGAARIQVASKAKPKPKLVVNAIKEKYKQQRLAKTKQLVQAENVRSLRKRDPPKESSSLKLRTLRKQTENEKSKAKKSKTESTSEVESKKKRIEPKSSTKPLQRPAKLRSRITRTMRITRSSTESSVLPHLRKAKLKPPIVDYDSESEHDAVQAKSTQSVKATQNLEEKQHIRLPSRKAKSQAALIVNKKTKLMKKKGFELISSKAKVKTSSKALFQARKILATARSRVVGSKAPRRITRSLGPVRELPLAFSLPVRRIKKLSKEKKPSHSLEVRTYSKGKLQSKKTLKNLRDKSLRSQAAESGVKRVLFTRQVSSDQGSESSASVKGRIKENKRRSVMSKTEVLATSKSDMSLGTRQLGHHPTVKTSVKEAAGPSIRQGERALSPRYGTREMGGRRTSLMERTLPSRSEVRRSAGQLSESVVREVSGTKRACRTAESISLIKNEPRELRHTSGVSAESLSKRAKKEPRGGVEDKNTPHVKCERMSSPKLILEKLGLEDYPNFKSTDKVILQNSGERKSQSVKFIDDKNLKLETSSRPKRERLNRETIVGREASSSLPPCKKLKINNSSKWERKKVNKAEPGLPEEVKLKSFRETRKSSLKAGEKEARERALPDKQQYADGDSSLKLNTVKKTLLTRKSSRTLTKREMSQSDLPGPSSSSSLSETIADAAGDPNLVPPDMEHMSEGVEALDALAGEMTQAMSANIAFENAEEIQSLMTSEFSGVFDENFNAGAMLLSSRETGAQVPLNFIQDLNSSPNKSVVDVATNTCEEDIMATLQFGQPEEVSVGTQTITPPASPRVPAPGIVVADQMPSSEKSKNDLEKSEKGTVETRNMIKSEREKELPEKNSVSKLNQEVSDKKIPLKADKENPDKKALVKTEEEVSEKKTPSKTEKEVTERKTPGKPLNKAVSAATPSKPKSKSVSPNKKARLEEKFIGKNKPFPSDNEQAQFVMAPVYYPTPEEFSEPMAYIKKISSEAEQYGICKIVPPSDFKPECKINDDMRFTAHNQYVHKMLYRWGPNVQHMTCIKKHLNTQGVTFDQPPVIGGIEVDLSHLYHTVQHFGGIQQVIEKQRWQRVADAMHIAKSAHDRVTKLYDVYCKYLLPYDLLSSEEKEKLEQEVAAEHEHNVQKKQGAGVNLLAEDDEESNECVTKGRNMTLSVFYRIARNTMSMWYKHDPSTEEAERDYWNLVTERKRHVVVHAGNIDSSVYGSGFPSGRNSPFSKHPWNLKVFTNNPGSILRCMGPVSGVTIPTLHVSMLYTTGCWYRDPHCLPWIEYLHTGANKIWYGVPASSSERLHKAMKEIAPQACKDSVIWLPSDTAMVPPPMLVQHGAPLSKTVQGSGQFVIIFPGAFTSTISCGYSVSESVYFATKDWLVTASNYFQCIKASCESPAFSLEKLLLCIATDPRTTPETCRRILSLIQKVCDEESRLWKQLTETGIKTFERLPITDAKDKKKKSRGCDEESENECEICRTHCYISMVVNTQDDTVYCLEHAAQHIAKKNFKSCKLLYIHDLDELNVILKKVKDQCDNQDQKDASKKKTQRKK